MMRSWALLVLIVVSQALAGPTVVDDLGNQITLQQPATRIISLAPHLTEIVYALGGGEQMTATVAWSDFPEEAKALPVVASNNKINYEALLGYQPDLVLAWLSGNGEGIIGRLRSLGLNVYVNKPRHLDDIPATLEKLGVLLGREEQAQRAIGEFQGTLGKLRSQYGQSREMSVYYQIWQSPLMTFGGSHLVSDVMKLCGGNNVFAQTPGLVPKLGVESVLAANPDVIIIGQYTALEAAYAHWQQWPQLTAVKNGHIYNVDPYLLHRHTPRIVQGAKQLCEAIQRSRINP